MAKLNRANSISMGMLASNPRRPHPAQTDHVHSADLWVCAPWRGCQHPAVFLASVLRPDTVLAAGQHVRVVLKQQHPVPCVTQAGGLPQGHGY